jgi:DNA-binding transcriptional MerR regulator
MEYLTEDNHRQINIAGKEGIGLVLENETYSIKQLGEFSGIKPHTIRIWEQRFAFLRPGRVDASRRVYTSQQIAFFLQVCLLKQNGYRMNDIAAMSNDKKNAILSNISGPQKYIKIIHELIGCMMSMDIVHFNNILDNCVLRWGIHETISCIILPFSERIGLFNNPEKRNYRQHIFLVQECIKQKVYLAIENIAPIVTSRKQPAVLLFLSGPSMELPLLYLHYIVKKEGFTTLYLGNYFSAAELNSICKKEKPAYVITNLRKDYRYKGEGEFIKDLTGYFAGSHFISAGKSLPADKYIYYYRDADHFPASIASLNYFPAG